MGLEAISAVSVARPLRADRYARASAAHGQCTCPEFRLAVRLVHPVQATHDDAPKAAAADVSRGRTCSAAGRRISAFRPPPYAVRTSRRRPWPPRSPRRNAPSARPRSRPPRRERLDLGLEDDVPEPGGGEDGEERVAERWLRELADRARGRTVEPVLDDDWPAVSHACAAGSSLIVEASAPSMRHRAVDAELRAHTRVEIGARRARVEQSPPTSDRRTRLLPPERPIAGAGGRRVGDRRVVRLGGHCPKGALRPQLESGPRSIGGPSASATCASASIRSVAGHRKRRSGGRRGPDGRVSPQLGIHDHPRTLAMAEGRDAADREAGELVRFAAEARRIRDDDDDGASRSRSTRSRRRRGTGSARLASSRRHEDERLTIWGSPRDRPGASPAVWLTREDRHVEGHALAGGRVEHPEDSRVLQRAGTAARIARAAAWIGRGRHRLRLGRHARGLAARIIRRESSRPRGARLALRRRSLPGAYVPDWRLITSGRRAG